MAALLPLALLLPAPLAICVVFAALVYWLLMTNTSRSTPASGVRVMIFRDPFWIMTMIRSCRFCVGLAIRLIPPVNIGSLTINAFIREA
ncbi:hypothetical protein D3C73_1305100 [compost metagenome]